MVDAHASHLSVLERPTQGSKRELRVATKQDLERHKDLVIALYRKNRLEDLPRLMQDEKGIYATGRTYRKALEKWKPKKYLNKVDRDRMIGIYRSWEKRGRKVAFLYNGEPYSVNRLAQYITENVKKGLLDENSLIAMEAYSGATPKDIFYFDPKEPNADLLHMDYCPSADPQIQNHIEYLNKIGPEIVEGFQIPTKSLSALPVQKESHSSPQSASYLERNGSELRAVEALQDIVANPKPISIWEWVTLHEQTQRDIPCHMDIMFRDRSLLLYEKHYGIDSYDASRMENLSQELLENDRFHDAEELDHLSVDLEEYLHGPNHIGTIMRKGSLARVLYSQGKYKAAQELETSVVDFLMDVRGEHHEDTLMYQANLSTTLLMQGSHKRAKELCLDVLKRANLVLGERHSSTLSYMLDLAKIYNAIEESHAAREILVKVTTTMEEELGFANRKTMEAYAELSATLQILGSYDEAIAITLRIEKELGEPNPTRPSWTLESVQNVGRLLYNLGQYVDAEAVFRNLHDTLSTRLSSRHPKVVFAAIWIANALHHQFRERKATAIGFYGLDISKEIFGPFHRQTLTWMSNLACYREGSLTLMEFGAEMTSVLQLRRSHLGEDDPDTLDSEMFCAEIQWRCGKWAEAQEIFKKIRRKQKDIYGTTRRPEVLKCLLNSAEVFVAREYNSEAIALHRKALALAITLFGQKHPKALMCMKPLAMSLARLNQYDEAEKLLSYGISELSGCLSPKHPRTLQLAMARAHILGLRGRWADAEVIQRQVLEEQQKYGDRHPHTIFAISALAESCAAQDKVPEAESLYSSAIEAAELAFGAQHRQVAFIVAGLAQLMSVQKRWQKAIDLRKQVLKMTRASFGCLDSLEHPATIAALEELALVLAKLNDFSAFRRLLGRVRGLKIHYFGHMHPETVRTISDLAQFHYQQGDYLTAMGLYREALEKTCTIFGVWHPQSLSARSSLCKVLNRLNLFMESRALCDQVLERMKSAIGEKSRETASAMRNLADLCIQQSQFVEAEKHLQDALQVFEELGEKPSKVVYTMINLSLCYLSANQVSKAEIQAKEAIFRGRLSLGENHRAVLLGQKSLAKILSKGKRFSEAEMIVKGLLQQEQEHGRQDSVSALELEDLIARIFQEQGKLRDAEKFLEECINRRRSKDLKFPGLLMLKDRLSEIKRDAGNLYESEFLLEEVLQAQEGSCIHSNLPLALTLSNLASAKRRLHKFSEAAKLQKRAVDMQSKFYGEDSLPHLEALTEFSLCLTADGCLEDRCILQLSILEKCIQIHGMKADELLWLQREIAETRMLMGDFKATEYARKQIVDSTSPSEDDLRQRYIWDLQFLAETYNASGKYKDTEEIYERLKYIIKGSFGKHHHTFTINLDNLAVAKLRLGKYHEAEILTEEAIQLDEQPHRKYNPEYLTSLRNLALVKNKLGKWKEARDLTMECVELRKRLSPEFSPSLATLIAEFEEAEGKCIDSEFAL